MSPRRTDVFTTKWSDEDQAWVATVHNERYLSWVDDSPSAALDGLLTVMMEDVE